MGQRVGDISDSQVSEVNFNNKEEIYVRNKKEEISNILSAKRNYLFWRNVLITISVVNLILNVICICHIFPRSSNFGIDYIGVIVGILGLLVTVLIGWNIFYALELKKDLILKMQERQIEAQNQLNDYVGKNQKAIEKIEDSIQNLYERTQTISNSLVDILKSTSVFNYTGANEQIFKTRDSLTRGLRENK